MWIMMIISYFIVSIIDTRGFSNLNSNGKLYVYIILMSASCAIGIASGYIDRMPSPSIPIKEFVLSIIGS